MSPKNSLDAREFDTQLARVDACHKGLLELQGKNCGVTVMLITGDMKQKLICAADPIRTPYPKKDRPDLKTTVEWGMQRKVALNGTMRDYRISSLEVAITDEAKERFIGIVQGNEWLWERVKDSLAYLKLARIGIRTYPESMGGGIMLDIRSELPLHALPRSPNEGGVGMQLMHVPEEVTLPVFRFVADEGQKKLQTLQEYHRGWVTSLLTALR